MSSQTPGIRRRALGTGLTPQGGAQRVRLESTWLLDSFPCDDDVLYVEEVFSMMSLKEICYG